MAKTDSKIKKTRKMSNNKRGKQYDENKLRIGKFYDINKCVERKSIGEQIKDGRDKVARNLRDPQFYKRQLYKRVPMVEWLMSYKLKAYLQADIVSGFTVGIMNIPQGMGYALLASLPPVGGLYISFFPLIVYAIFGTSRHLAIGSIAIVSLLSGGVVDAMVASHGPFPNEHGNGTDTDALNAFKIKVVCSLSLLVGILQVLMGVFGLGIVSSYFSHAFISGYTCGSAVQVLTSQIKDVFGLKGLTKYNGAFKIPLTIIDILRKMGTTNIPTLVLSIISIIYLIIFKEFINPKIKRKLKLEFPSELLLVIVTTILSTFTGFQSKFKIDIVGTIPKGLPMPDMPDLSLWPNIIKDAIVIALIAFSINASLGTLFARKHKYRINPTQELVAYGLSNVFGSFFSCYPSAASLSRSSVLESTGGKTSLGPLLSSLVILVVILFLNPYFQPLPRAVLACIIVVALKNLLFQVKDLITYWKYSKLEAAVWLGAFLGVVLLDVDIGLIIGIVISLLTVIIKDQLLRLKQLKKYTDIYVDKDYVISKAPRKIETTDNKTELHWQEYEIFKVQSAIYFANCEKLKILLEKAIESREEAEAEARRSSLTVDVATTDLIEQKPSSSSNNVNAVEPIISEDSSQNYLILDFAAVNHTDSDGVKMLQQLVKDLTARKFSIYICQFQDSFIRMLHRMNLIEFFDPYLYLTIQEAVEDIESKNFDLVNASNF